MVEYTPIVGIAIVLYAMSEILKRTVFKSNADMKAVIPYICAVVGACAAAIIFVINPSIISANNILDAVVMGALSGLLATGANQIYKQFLNLLTIAKSTSDDINNNVASMTTEEKKDYLTNVAVDVTKDLLNKLNEVSEESNGADGTVEIGDMQINVSGSSTSEANNTTTTDETKSS